MRITSLKLQNIRSYVEETIEFPHGSVLLAGDIGAGKSTILLAIEYALFGTKRGELESSSLLRNGSHAGKIELDFDLNGNAIKITRILKRTPTAIKQDAGYIVINNKRIDATPVELRARVMELLGYPRDAQSLTKDLIYRYTVFTPQEQMRQILYEPKENRLNTLRKIFNIDKYKKIKDNAEFIAKELRAKKRLLEETVTDVSLLEEQQKRFNEKQKEQEQTYAGQFLHFQQIQEKKQLAFHSVEAAEAEQKHLHDLRQQHVFHEIEIKKISVQIQSLKQKQQQIHQQKDLLQRMQSAQLDKPSERSKQEIETEKESLEKVFQELQQANALVVQQKKNLSESLASLQKSLVVLEQQLQQQSAYEQEFRQLDAQLAHKPSLQKHITDLEQEIQKCRDRKAAVTARKQHAQKTMETMETLDVCTLCLQGVDHDHKEKIISDQKAVLHDAEQEFEQSSIQEQLFQQQLLEAKKQFTALLAGEQKKASLTILLQNLAEKQGEFQQKQQQVVDIQKQLTTLILIPVEELAHKQKLIADLKILFIKMTAWETAIQEQKSRSLMIADKEAQEKEIEKEQQQLILHIKTIEEQKQLLTEKLHTLKDVEITLSLRKQELQKIQDSEKHAEILLATIRKELEHLAEQQEHLTFELQKRRSIQMKIKKVHATAQWFDDYFIPLVSTMEKHVLLQVHMSFNSFFTAWFSTLIGESMTARLDENFTPIIEQNGYETDLVDLSGGEKTAVSLAYRLALNKVVNDFISTIATKDFIILDEPTEGFSTEQLDTVREVLDALALKQIILVSHEQKIESFVEHVIKIEKQGHISKILN